MAINPLTLPLRYCNVEELKDGWRKNVFYNFFAKILSTKIDKNQIVAQVQVKNQVYQLIHSIKLKNFFLIGRTVALCGEFGNNNTIYFPKLEHSKVGLLPKYEKGYGSKSLLIALKKICTPSLLALFEKIHAPENISEVQDAMNRLLHYELAIISKIIQDSREDKIPKKIVPINYNLPFDLTERQIAAIETINNNLISLKKTITLLYGDVGSGKTVVAYCSALLVLKNNYNVAIIVPTSLLAQQTYNNFCQYSKEISISLVKSGKTAKIYSEPTIYIGTHALFFTSIKNIGLLIIDEQQRFGVLQRNKLYQEQTDVLMMTATPIPRTLAMSNQMTTIELQNQHLVAQRKTYIMPQDKFEILINKIATQEQQKRIVWIEHSIKEAKNIFEKLKNIGINNVFLVHGKMKNKYEILTRFSEVYGILVSTTVIEVGIDMDIDSIIIAQADRFGLAQIHQLRGRIARRKNFGTCILLGHNMSKLRAIQKADDGFKISELDLKIRGAGNILSQAQSGFDYVRFSKKIVDGEIVSRDMEISDIRESAKVTLNENIIRVLSLEGHGWQPC